MIKLISNYLRYIHYIHYRLCTANVDGEKDMITYTQCLSEDGTLEADITVSKASWDQFTVICTDTAHRHVQALLNRNLDPDATKNVTVTGMLDILYTLN